MEMSHTLQVLKTLHDIWNKWKEAEKLNGNKRRLRAAINRTLIVIAVVKVNDPEQRRFLKQLRSRSGATYSICLVVLLFLLLSPFQVLNRLELIRIRGSFVRADAPPYYCRSILLVLLPSLAFPSTPLRTRRASIPSRISLAIASYKLGR